MRYLVVLLLAIVLQAALPGLWPGAVLSGAALAQGASEPDYAGWETDAAAAEALLKADRVANATLDELRARIVQWRATFLAAQSANSSQIETVRNQIAALGPAPEKDVPEAEDIAKRRSELSEQLAT